MNDLERIQELTDYYDTNHITALSKASRMIEENYNERVALYFSASKYEMPSWLLDIDKNVITPNRITMLASFITVYNDIYETIKDSDVLYRIFNDNTLDDDVVADILKAFTYGFNLYENYMFEYPIGPEHIKEIIRIMNNRCNNLLTLDQANELIDMITKVSDFDDMDTLHKVQSKRIEYLNANRMAKLEAFIDTEDEEDEIVLNVFCAFPMHGLSHGEVEIRRCHLFKKICEYFAKTKEGYKEALQLFGIDMTDEIDKSKYKFKLLDQVNKENVPENASRIWYLADSIQVLDKANIVVFGDDWKEAKGCNVEMEVCIQYGKHYYVEGVDF